MPGKKGYRPSLQNAKLHRERMEGQRWEPEPEFHTGGSYDPLVVRTADLAPFIERFVEAWEKERPRNFTLHHSEAWDQTWDGKKNGSQFGADDVFFGALDWLAQESQLNVRVIYRVKSLETKHTAFRIAEALLSALDCDYKLQNGEIPVVANPQWSQEKWAAWARTRGCY